MGSCDIFLLLFLLVFYLIFLLICFVQLQLICQFVQIVFDIGIFFTIKKSKFRKYSWQLNFSLNDSKAFIIKVFRRFQFLFFCFWGSLGFVYITLFFSGGGGGVWWTPLVNAIVIFFFASPFCDLKNPNKICIEQVA